MSIACCFIQREVQTELLVFGLNILKRVKCFRSLKCINYLEDKFQPSRRFNLTTTNEASKKKKQLKKSDSKSDSKLELRRASTNPLDAETLQKRYMVQQNRMSKESTRSSYYLRNQSTTISEMNAPVMRKICCCLFTNTKNDFFQSEKSRKSSNFFRELYLRRKSSAPKKFQSLSVPKDETDKPFLQNNVIHESQDEIENKHQKFTDSSATNLGNPNI